MAVGAIEVEIIVPPAVRMPLPRRKIMSQLRRFSAGVKTDFDKTMATWADHPDFKRQVSFRAGVAMARVHVRDKVYGALDEGTKVRWALLSKDWRSKTRPGFIGSGPGAGRVLMRGRKMRKAGIPPGPGIKARGWSGVIAEKHKPIFERDMELAVNEAIMEAMGLT